VYRFLLLSLATIAAVAPPVALAQFETAAVLGVIRDPTGGAVANCAVTLEGVDTGVTARAVTDSSGNYEFFNVRIGRYRVTAEHPGFKKAVSDLFTVSVSARQRVNLSLEVGDVTESVTVLEAAALLETDSSSRGTIIGRQQAVDLPLNGRAYADLALLTPGVTQALKGSVSGRDASYHVNGLRSSFNNFLLDGVENNAYGTSNQGFSNQVVQLSPDAVGEFKVTTNNYSAEYGRAGGAVISASLRSGTNDLHLTLWEFLRNTKLNAEGFFKPRFGKPTLVQNQFGVAAGGRIVKNKTFWFADYEGFRRSQKRLVFATLPSTESRQGILNLPLMDPYSGAPISGGRVPASQITPFAAKVLADLPAPNRAGAGSLGVGDNFESLPTATTPDNKGNFKLDHYFSRRVTSFFRYSHREVNAFEPPAIPGPSGGDSNGYVRVFNQSLAAGATYSVTPGSLIELRLGVTRTEGGKMPPNSGLPHIEQTYGIRGIPKDPRIGGGLNSQQVGGFTNFGRQSSNPQFQNPDVWNPRVNFSSIRGPHSLKFGYEYQRIDTEINDLAPVYGLSGYAGRFTSPTPGSGSELYNLADFLLGAQSTLEKTNFEVLDYRQRMHFFYVQDDWKAASRLTLNLGVRYEFATPQWEANNRLGNFDPNTNSLIFAKSGSLYDRALVDPDYNNWAPRLGLAYSLNRRTVLRSGYGVSYVHFNRMGGENILGFTGPFVLRVTQNQVAPAVPRGGQPLCAPGQTRGCFIRTQDGFPADFNDPAKFDPTRTRINYTPRDTRTGYVQSWHLTVQRQLSANAALDLAYVGSRGAKQLILGDYNQARPNRSDENLSIDQRRPIPGFSEIQISFGAGNTFYHSLQAKFEKKYSGGLYLINSFTWSKAIDNATGHLEEGFNGDTSRINFYNLKSERALSSFDTPLNNVTALIWNIPFGAGRRYGRDWNPFTNAVLGGWRVTLINNLRSGNPVNIYYNPSSAFRVCSSCRQRPNLLGPFQTENKDINRHFIAENIEIPTDRRFPFGNAGRNIGRTRGFAQADFGLYKEFPLPLREGARVEFRSEFFNLMNHSNFRGPNSARDSSSFGVVTSTFPARQIQFALKLYY
jgi:hypothetical protein